MNHFLVGDHCKVFFFESGMQMNIGICKLFYFIDDMVATFIDRERTLHWFFTVAVKTCDG